MINYLNDWKDLKKLLCENEKFNPFLNQISRPFIPAFDVDFDQSYCKTVLVGQETAGWRGKLHDLVLGDLTFEEHIQDSKARYLELYNSPSKGLPFLSLLGKIKSHDGNTQWLNFYICDFKKASFNNLNNKRNCTELYNLIRDYSIRNLVNQLNQLQPKNIIFTGNYHGNWEALKSKYVNHEEILMPKTNNENFSLRFWNHQTLVIRTPHPASRIPNKVQLQNLALNYYKIFNTEAEQDVKRFKEILLSID